MLEKMLDTQLLEIIQNSNKKIKILLLVDWGDFLQKLRKEIQNQKQQHIWIWLKLH